MLLKIKGVKYHVQDVARMALAALRNDATAGRTLTLAGPKAWTTAEVIALCEKLADARAEVTQVPLWLLKSTRNFLRGFQWARDASDRLVCSLTDCCVLFYRA